MKKTLLTSSVLLLLLGFPVLALASTSTVNNSVTISGNGEGSNTSVSIKNSTGTNINNTQSTGQTKTRIEVDGKVYVDETTEGGSTNISVKKSGDAEPQITYEVKKDGTKPTSALSEEQKAALEEKKNDAIKKLEEAKAKNPTLFQFASDYLESVFTRFRSFFSFD